MEKQRPRTAGNFEEERRLNAEIRREVRKSKRILLKLEARESDWKIAKRLRSKPTPKAVHLNIQDKSHSEGRSTATTAAEGFAAFNSEIRWGHTDCPVFDYERPNEWKQLIDFDISDITIAEVRQAISRQKKCKASGPDVYHQTFGSGL